METNEPKPQLTEYQKTGAIVGIICGVAVASIPWFINPVTDTRTPIPLLYMFIIFVGASVGAILGARLSGARSTGLSIKKLLLIIVSVPIAFVVVGGVVIALVSLLPANRCYEFPLCWNKGTEQVVYLSKTKPGYTKTRAYCQRHVGSAPKEIQ
jgi:hypothetical protein